MVEQIVTNVLGTIVLLITVVGTYYANGLRSALEGSELSEVWKYVGLGVIFLFLTALAGGGASLIGLDTLSAVLSMLVLASAFLTYGLKLQLDKVK